MADPFYSSCADVLSVCQANKEDLDALLDPKTGFASRLRDLCQEQCVQQCSSICEADPTKLKPRLKAILASDLGYIPQEKIDALQMESNTWALLQSIMPCVYCSISRENAIESRNLQASKATVSRVAFTPTTLTREPIYPDIHSCSSNYALFPTVLRTCHRSRVASRHRSPTPRARRRHRILEVHKVPADAGVANGEQDAV